MEEDMTRRYSMITRKFLLILFLCVGVTLFAHTVYAQSNGVVDGPPPEGNIGTAPVPIDGLWQEFSWSGTLPIQARGCAPADPLGTSCVPSSAGNSEFAPAPPWTFEAPAAGAEITIVVDAFTIGDDHFEVFDFGTSIGFTSAPGTTGSCGSDPEVCLQNPNASKGTFGLGPGPHSITINVLAGSLSQGASYFRVASCDHCLQDGFNFVWCLNEIGVTSTGTHLMSGTVKISAPNETREAVGNYTEDNRSVMIASGPGSNNTPFIYHWDDSISPVGSIDVQVQGPEPSMQSVFAGGSGYWIHLLPNPSSGPFTIWTCGTQGPLSPYDPEIDGPKPSEKEKKRKKKRR